MPLKDGSTRLANNAGNVQLMHFSGDFTFMIILPEPLLGPLGIWGPGAVTLSALSFVLGNATLPGRPMVQTPNIVLNMAQKRHTIQT